MWIVLVWLFLSEGFSFSIKCSEIRNISVFPKEPFTLDLDEDGVEEISLVDDSGTDMARINSSGELTVLDKHYKYNLSVKGFFFHIQNNTIKDQEKFTASVMYKNGTHCSQHYLVIVRGDQICSEKKEIIYTFQDSYFTLEFNSTGVEKITWVDNNDLNIAITKRKNILQILITKFEGMLSVIGVSLRKHSVTIKDHGQYTARVIFQNGTWCSQQYVTIYDYQWFYYFTPCLNSPTAIVYLALGSLFALVGYMVKRFLMKKKNEREQKKSEYVLSDRIQGESWELTNMTRQRRVKPDDVTKSNLVRCINTSVDPILPSHSTEHFHRTFT